MQQHETIANRNNHRKGIRAQPEFITRIVKIRESVGEYADVNQGRNLRRSVNHQFTLPVKETKVNKSKLLSIYNPSYCEIINKRPI